MIVTKFLLLAALVIIEGDCFYNLKDTFNPQLDDDGYLESAALARRYGYRCEEHFVTTSDGYILKLLRLNGRINGSVVSSSAPTVFLQHGIFGADFDFILDGPKDIGGLLSDYGFDIWMGNHRGNRYSKNHTTFTTNSREFWKFNYNEMSQIDIATFLDYILEHVKKTSLHVVGYSQGGFMLSLLLAYKPEYNAKVKSLTYLASAIYPGKLKLAVLNSLAELGDDLSRVSFIQENPFELPPQSNDRVSLAYKLCNINSLFFPVCVASNNLVFGEEKHNIDLNRMPYYVAQTGGGASSNQLLHTAQIFTNNRLELFDYGPRKNMLKYGQPLPPRANFSLITPPKLFFYGTEDHLITEECVNVSISLTVNVEKVVRVDSYNHFDLMHALSLKEKVVDVLKDFIISHE